MASLVGPQSQSLCQGLDSPQLFVQLLQQRSSRTSQPEQNKKKSKLVMYLPRESKLVAPALDMTSHSIRSVWMPRGSDQWIDSLKASSVFYIVLIAPDVPAPSIRLVNDTLAVAVDLLDTVRKGHLVWVGAVSGRRLRGSEEARSTFACVPVCHAAGSPLHKRGIKGV